ncbi:hypothetical protein KI387_010637 [Taxus chinensis]|uniref:RanBP2-type domain-containing protein n=1 Tax=Taxus chinensis TaxID=29808 RepID=A0AA38FMS0_TAXCH|nr:hypothetical protein KI387_010637 [Taxus chinensis]
MSVMGIPITVSLVSVMVLVYLRPPQFLEDSCTPTKDFDPKQWFLSIFHHASKGQFAYQIISLLCKGTILEGSIGSRRFASVVLKLLLTIEGMIVMAVKGMQLWGEANIFSSICGGHLWSILFGMYGFILSTCQNWNALVIAATFTAELASVYFLYPFIPVSGPVCGTLAGLLCSYAPQLAIRCWNMTFPLQMIEVQQNSYLNVWNCQSCQSGNGVFVFACENCGVPREHVAYDNSVMDDPQSSVINRMISDSTEPVWNCMSCRSQNGVFVHACETCGTERPIYN